MLSQATLGSFLSLPENERVAKVVKPGLPKQPKNAGLSARESRKRNTEARYLSAMGKGRKSSQQIADTMKINVSAVNRQMLRMLHDGKVRKFATRKGRTNTANVWEVVK